MARLNPREAQDRAKAPKHKDRIEAARRDASRILMHTEPVSRENDLPLNPIQTFRNWVAKLLPAEKMERFANLVTMPLDTIESTKGIFDELSTVFDAQDQYIKFDFTNPTFAADFDDYRKQIGESQYWRTTIWNQIRSAPSSYLVVDMDSEPTTGRPAPYFYTVSIFEVIDAEINHRTGAVEYLIFRRKDGKIVCLDDEFYRVMEKDDQTGEWNITLQNPHSTFGPDGRLTAGIGYTPAHSVYDIALEFSEGLSKRGPISDTLGKLDWILFWRTSKKYLDLYGAYPIMSSYERECAYQDEHGNQCVEGFVTREIPNGIDPGTHPEQIRCPACAKGTLIGPGSYITVPSPADNTYTDLNENPVKFIEMSNDKLDYGVKETERIEGEVYLNCVGADGNAMNTQAVNENQVQANFESKEAVLFRIKQQIEKVALFGLSTLCKLRYGNAFVNGVYDLGNEWFLTRLEDLLKQLKDAKSIGLPMYYLATLREQIIRTKFRNNPEQQARDYILRQIEPWPDLTLSECANFWEMDPKNYILKVNFSSFIDRFEREQMNIVEFGSLTNFNSKISTITTKLFTYVDERISASPGAQSQSGGDGGSQNRAGTGQGANG